MKALPVGSATKWARYEGAAAVICRAALARGPLVEHRTLVKGGRSVPHYRFGSRMFNVDTVNALIDAGLAERIGDKVVACG